MLAIYFLLVKLSILCLAFEHLKLFVDVAEADSGPIYLHSLVAPPQLLSTSSITDLIAQGTYQHHQQHQRTPDVCVICLCCIACP